MSNASHESGHDCNCETVFCLAVLCALLELYIRSRPYTKVMTKKTCETLGSFPFQNIYKPPQTDMVSTKNVYRLIFPDSLNPSFMAFKIPLAKTGLYKAVFPKWTSFNAACSGQSH